MSNVRPGDRAVVIRCSVPANLGKIVRVIEEAVPVPGRSALNGGPVYVWADGTLERHQGRLSWVVEAEGGPFAYVRSDGVSFRRDLGIFPDDHLHPLRFTRDPDEVLEIAGPPHLQGVKA